MVWTRVLKDNLSDGPSRGGFSLLDSLGARWCGLVILGLASLLIDEVATPGLGA